MASIERLKWQSLFVVALVVLISCGESEPNPAADAQKDVPPTTQSAAPAAAKPTWNPGFGKEPLGYINPQPERVAQGAPWQMSGWAVDDQDGAPIRSVTVYIDDLQFAKAALGFPRPDVADTLGRPEMRRSGWVAAIDTDKLGVGKHQYKAVAEDKDGNQVDLRPSRPPAMIEIVSR